MSDVYDGRYDYDEVGASDDAHYWPSPALMGWLRKKVKSPEMQDVLRKMRAEEQEKMSNEYNPFNLERTTRSARRSIPDLEDRIAQVEWKLKRYEGRRERAEKDIAEAQALLTKLRRELRFGDEPEIGTTIRFPHSYGEPKFYVFVAYRAGNGLWYLTGRVTEAYTWEHLTAFIGDAPVTVLAGAHTL